MVHISHLRDKIEEDPKNPCKIKTIRGIGYRFEKKFNLGKNRYKVSNILLRNYLKVFFTYYYYNCYYISNFFYYRG